MQQTSGRNKQTMFLDKIRTLYNTRQIFYSMIDQLSAQNMLFYTEHKTNHKNVKFLTHIAWITAICMVSVLTMLQKHIATVTYNTTSQLLQRCSLLHVHQPFRRTQCFQNCFLPNLHCCESLNLIFQKQMHERTDTHMGMILHALFPYTECIFNLLPLLHTEFQFTVHFSPEIHLTLF